MDVFSPPPFFSTILFWKKKKKLRTQFLLDVKKLDCAAWICHAPQRDVMLRNFVTCFAPWSQTLLVTGAWIGEKTCKNAQIQWKVKYFVLFDNFAVFFWDKKRVENIFRLNLGGSCDAIFWWKWRHVSASPRRRRRRWKQRENKSHFCRFLR